MIYSLERTIKMNRFCIPIHVPCLLVDSDTDGSIDPHTAILESFYNFPSAMLDMQMREIVPQS